MHARSRLLPRGLLPGLILAALVTAPLVFAILLDFLSGDEPERTAAETKPGTGASAVAKP